MFRNLPKFWMIIIVNTVVLSQANALVGAGTFAPNFLKAQTAMDGERSRLELNPFISFDYVFKLPRNHYFDPEIGYVFNQDAEDETTHSTLFLLYNLEFPVHPQVLLRYGFGTFISKVGGDGQALTMNNGTTTATFYTPSESHTSYTSSLNLGVKYFFDKKLASRFDLNVMRFVSDGRSLSYLLSITYN